MKRNVPTGGNIKHYSMKKPLKKQTEKYLKKRVPLTIEGHTKCNHKKIEKDRKQFGTSRCDSYGLSYYLGNLLANNLFQYCADANTVIIREDFKLIAKHAQSIRDFTCADSWDELSKDEKVKTAYLKKKKGWEEAMDWLKTEWKGLWW